MKVEVRVRVEVEELFNHWHNLSVQCVAYIILISRNLLLSPSIPSLYTALAIIIRNTVAIYHFCRRDRHLSLPSYFSFAFCRCRHLFIKIVAIYHCWLLMLSPSNAVAVTSIVVTLFYCRYLLLSPFPLSPSVAVVIYRTSSISVTFFAFVLFRRRLLSLSLSIAVAL